MKLLAGIAISLAMMVSPEPASRPDPFFVEGNELLYRTVVVPRDGAGTDVQATLRIKNVVKRGSTVVSEGELGYPDVSKVLSWKYRVRFACDSLNFYVHAMNWLYEPISKDLDFESVYEGDSLAYPLQLKVGDTLPSAHAKRSYAAKGTRDLTVMDFTERKVVSLDTIETAFGMKTAYRIEMKVHTTSKYISGPGGKRESGIAYMIDEWFIPATGIVRSEYAVGNVGTFRITMLKYRMD